MKSLYILRRTQNFAKSSPYFWLALHRTKVRWRFRKILWPSQNIWTLIEILLQKKSQWDMKGWVNKGWAVMQNVSGQFLQHFLFMHQGNLFVISSCQICMSFLFSSVPIMHTYEFIFFKKFKYWYSWKVNFAKNLVKKTRNS